MSHQLTAQPRGADLIGRRIRASRVAPGALLLLISGASCAPKAELTVVPRRSCATHAVAVNAHTKGKRTLTVTPVGFGPGADTTRFTLIAVRHKDTASAIVDAIFFPANGVDVPVFLQHATQNGATVVWTDTLLADEWGDQLRIQTVANRSGVPLTVAHQGRTAVVDTAGGGSSALQGVAMGGPWTATATVTPAAAPTHLELLVHLTCGPSGATP